MAEQRSTLIIEISSEQALRNAHALDRELQSIERTGNHATTSMNSMSVACRQLAGYMMGIVTVGGAIAKMDDWTNLNNRLRLVTDTQKELTLAMKDTFDIAQRSGSAWGGTATIYQKIQYNSEKLGLTQEKVAKITESISKSISNSGSSAQAASAALYQLGQSFDKSSLNGDEFVSMSENAGYLMEVFAKGLGVTRAELKEMSSQGQLTTDKMIEAIQKMSGSIEDDFGKTNFTIGQSFTQLSNAVTKFVGEAGTGSGAAAGLSGAISSLAKNLGTVANIAVIGGVALLTKTILSQTVAIYGSVTATIQRRAVDLVALQSQVQLAAIEVQRTKQVAALALTEIHLSRQQLNGATTRQARAAATIRLTQAEIALAIAQKQTSTATLAQATAENTLNAARSRSAMLLAAVGGPIGAITIGVTALAAGYMYMASKTAEANKKLQEQADVAKQTKTELLALEGAQKKGAVVDLNAAFDAQNKSLYALTFQFNAYMRMIEDANKGNEEVIRLSNLVHSGKMSEIDALRALNKMDVITPEQFKQGQNYVNTLDKTRSEAQGSANALKLFGISVELMGNKASNSSSGVAAIGKEAVVTSEKVKGLDADIQKFISNSLNNLASNQERLKLYAQGYTKESADMVLKYREAMGLIGTDQQLPLGTIALMGKELLVQTQLKEIEDKRSKAEKDRTKELEKQQQIIQVNAKVQANATKYNFNGIEGKYGLPSGLLSGIHMQESRGHSNAVGPQTKYGTAKGGFQFLDSTAKRFKLFGNDVFDLGKSADAAGQYLQLLYKKFGDWDKAISAYHAGEGNVERGTNIGPVNRQYVKNIKGYVAGVNGYSGSTKDFDSTMDDQAKYAQKTLEEIDQLNAKYSNADITRNKDRLTEIAEAERLGQTQLIDQINLRYSDESYLAKLQLDQQVNGWKWVGEERINKEAEINRAVTNASKEFSKDQKQLVMNGIDALSKYEIDEYRKTQQLKIVEYEQAYGGNILNAQLKISQYTMNPNDFGKYSLTQEQSRGYGENDKSYQEDLLEVDEAFKNKEINQDQHHQRILNAQRLHKENEYALSLEYKQKEEVLAHTQYESQMGMYSQMISAASGTWGQMTSIIKDAQGENSSAYKAMFLVQQTMAAAQAIIYANVASAAALAPPPIGLGPIAGAPLSAMLKITGYANAGLIMAQGITGMAHDGIDNVPKEGTWLLDKGERVVDSRTNADLKNYLSNSKQQGAQIVINNNASTRVSATQGTDGKTYITIDEVEGFINNSLQNPNSSMSKGISRGFNTQRRR